MYFQLFCYSLAMNKLWQRVRATYYSSMVDAQIDCFVETLEDNIQKRNRTVFTVQKIEMQYSIIAGHSEEKIWRP